MSKRFYAAMFATWLTLFALIVASLYFAETKLSALSSLLAILATMIYIHAVVFLGAKPSRATWLVWTSLTAITAGGMWQAGALSVQISIIVICDALILLFAFYYAKEWEWKPIEKWTMGASALIIIVWIFAKDPLWAILLSLAAVTIGTGQTFKNAATDPKAESPWAYLPMILSSACQFASIPEEQYSFETLSQPIVYMSVAGTIALLAMYSRARPYISGYFLYR